MKNKTVAIIGAGPAGLYAARSLTRAGVSVTLFNRDIKPGGLAEYGIFHTKHKMKEGLRKQFRRILSEEKITYFGNVTIGRDGDFTLNDLRAFGFDAILVTVGAQSTKWLGLPGEDLRGVYHAKDLVYHYNHLPPFSEQTFDIGRRTALIGVGNVMVDIAHYLARDVKIDSITAVARRGPAEVKFTRQEFEHIVKNLELSAFDGEMTRVSERMTAVEQSPQEAREYILSAQEKGDAAVSDTRFGFRFFSSPTRLVGDAQGRVAGLEVEDTHLVLQDGVTKARGLGTYTVLDVDTVIFCIGDRVDENLGLPVTRNEFAKNPQPRFPVNNISFEVFNLQRQQVIEDVFVAGWARKASSGLVGVARKDGENGAQAVLQYLESLGNVAGGALDALLLAMKNLDKPVVTKADWQQLEKIEQTEAEKRGLPEFKFDSNQEMFQAMGV